MRKLALGALALVAAAGCGGGGAAGIGSSGPPDAPESGRFEYKPLATARVDLDFETGKVKVTPLDPKPDGRAIWAGSTVEAQASDIFVSDGATTMRSFNLSLKNNTGDTIGADTGVRVQFRPLEFVAPDIRSLATVSTLAGNGTNSSTDGEAAAATTVPHALAAMPGGGVALLDVTRLRLFKNGFLTTVAQGISTGSGLVVVKDPGSAKVYAFVAEQTGHRIRSVDMGTGLVSAFAGTGVAGDVVGAPGTSQFNSPRGLAWDGTAVLVADSVNGKVKRIPVTFGPSAVTAGTVTTAHTGLSLPSALAIHDGYLAIAEESAHRVHLVKGSASIFIGSGTQGYLNGTAATARFSNPCALSWSGGIPYVAKSNIGSISSVWRTSDGDPNSPESYLVGLVAGTGVAGYAEGSGDAARFSTQATGLLAEGARIFVGDRNNRRLRAIDFPGDFVQGGFAGLNGATWPSVKIANRDGFIGTIGSAADGLPYLIRTIALSPGVATPYSRVDMLLENGVKRYAFHLIIEGAAYGFASPEGISRGATPGPGTSGVWVERIVETDSFLEVVGPVGEATLPNIVDLDSDASGNLYIATSKTIVRFDVARQRFATIAGVSQSAGQTVNGGVSARFEDITGIAVTADGATIYTTQNNHVVRTTQWNGLSDRNSRSNYTTATTLGSAGVSGNMSGVGADVRFNQPQAIAVNDSGETLVVTDSVTNRVFVINYEGGSPSSEKLLPASHHASGLAANASETIFDLEFGTNDSFYMVHGLTTTNRINKFGLAAWSTTPWVSYMATDSDTGALVGGYGISGL